MLTSEIEMIPTVPSFCQTCINNSQSKHKRHTALHHCDSSRVIHNIYAKMESRTSQGPKDIISLGSWWAPKCRRAAALRIPVQNAPQNILYFKTALQSKAWEGSHGLLVIYEVESLWEDLFSFCLWASQSVTTSLLLAVFIWEETRDCTLANSLRTEENGGLLNKVPKLVQEEITASQFTDLNVAWGGSFHLLVQTMLFLSF